MSIIDGWFTRKQQSQSHRSGLFHYRVEGQDEKSRVHLRLDPDGHGTLIVNANRILHLNPTAALMAHLVLEKTPEQDAIRTVRQQYRVSSSQARADLQAIQNQLAELIRPDGACPVHDLELETVAPFSARPSAPYRMDLAVTYRCNNDCSHCYNARDRSFPELDTGEWKRVLDKAMGTGYPACGLYRRRTDPALRFIRIDRSCRAEWSDHRIEHQRPQAGGSALRRVARRGGPRSRPDHGGIG